MKKLDLLEGKEYKVLSTAREYPQFTGREKWIIVSEITEKELIARYKEEIDAYYPWIWISLDQYSVIVDWRRNEVTAYRRSCMEMVSYGVDVSYVEKLRVEELIVPSFEDMCFLDRVGDLSFLDVLTETERNRLMMYYVDEMTQQEIADLEKVSRSPVRRAIKKAVQKLLINYPELAERRRE